MELGIVNDVDITPYINTKTYNVNSEAMYESFENANYVETRIFTRKKIKGSFEVALYGKNGMDYETFLENWNAAVNDGILLIGLWVMNDNYFETIEAYYKLNCTKHAKLMDGTYIDRITITIEER